MFNTKFYINTTRESTVFNKKYWYYPFVRVVSRRYSQTLCDRFEIACDPGKCNKIRQILFKTFLTIGAGRKTQHLKISVLK